MSDDYEWNSMEDGEDQDDEYAGPDAYIDEDEIVDQEEEAQEELERAMEEAGEEVEDLAEEAEEMDEASRSDLAGILTAIALLRGGHAGGSFDLDSQSLVQLQQVLDAARSRRRSSRRVLEEDEDDEDEYWSPIWSRHRRDTSPKKYFEEVTEPQPAGTALLKSGEFGRQQAQKGPRNVARVLRQREMETGPRYRQDIARNMVPNTDGTVVAMYAHNVYSGQYSRDSSFFYTCSQDFRLHVYDASTPPGQRIRTPYHETTMKTINTIQGSSLGTWTITDSHLSPDNERLIYASICPTVFMTKTFDPMAEQIPIKFSEPRARSYHWGWDEDSFGIWSCRFSADGTEIVAGGSGLIFVYDLNAQRRTVRIQGHDNDVNSVCWADTASGNVLISGSDDTFVKVWDRRSLGSHSKPAGVLVGHTEGITYVSSKGDGRYVISNGKDQALRLWDLRKMRSSADFDSLSRKHYGLRNFDYRHGYYGKPRFMAHPEDCSVMTYRGHAVLRTLIRCHFSPAETTGSAYLYSGSSDGKIHIWSLDGRVVQVLDRGQTLPISYDPSEEEPPRRPSRRSNVCVRDVSWHSREPVLMSCGWDGSGRGSASSVARHEFKGLGKFGGRLEDLLEKEREENRSGSRVPGAWDDE